ncbi:DUF2231 domain-containing protein [Flavobacterium sp.]|uniref:DUF2231 domain-containing protein n=1 Tax=Flavobacterium sp. TaxID=239 RepID=UPI00286E16A7|nr:DUF2231 domain-containing protein [Flavobacterium sp.]
MNDAHLHLLINHFPIVGTIFGLGILLAGIISKNKSIQNTAYAIFIVCMILGKVSMFTGEKAEDIVENLGISQDLIHEHEEQAETYMKLAYALGLISILGLISNFKNHPKAKLFSFLALTLAIVTVILSKAVGTSGGEIRHTEIRQTIEIQNVK